jgi:hypothetical protein
MKKKIPGPLWIALLSLSIMILLKLVMAFNSSPLLLVDAILCGILLYGLGFRRQWAYSYAIFLALAGTAFAMYLDMMYGIVAMVTYSLVLVPMLMCTQFFHPRKSLI